jgi:glycosyltransferase involved in cell wall biosynthesis
MQKLAIISTHPIQYNAPFFKLLSERKKVELKVFYTWSQSKTGSKYDPGFGKEIEWDIPLLDGYDYCFVNNVSNSPGSHHFKGIDNPTLIKEISNWGANAVLVYGWSFKSHFKAMLYFKGNIPVFFRGDSTLLDEQTGFKKTIRRFVLKFIYSKIDIALYAGNANKAYFLANGVKENSLVFMPHAIDNNRFAVNDKNKSAAIEVRNNLKIPSNGLVFLFAGKLEPKKQPDLLANIFCEIENNTAHLIIAGNGVLENSLKAGFGHLVNIHFLDFQNQQAMPGLYAACDVFVLPSKGPNETWGLAINEAMAAGKPIIVSKACGVAYDLVENKVTGFTFEKNDKKKLREHLEYFISNESMLKVMSNEVLNKIALYSFENDCTAVENLLMSKNGMVESR